MTNNNEKLLIDQLRAKLAKMELSLKEANLKLSKSELLKSNLAIIVESTHDAVISRNLNGEILSWNNGAENLYGYTKEEMLGKSVAIIYPPDKQAEFTDTNEKIKKGESLRLLETTRLHKSGNIFPVSVVISPIKDSSGEVIGSCSIARDITEWKEIERIKNEFISIVSHELRTPMTSIQGSLSLLLSGAGGALPQKAITLLNIGKQNSERLIRLINDILDISKIESGEMQFNLADVNIGLILQEAILVNQSFADNFNISIQFEQRSSELVHVDRDRLLQVISNLLSNAIKFSTAPAIKVNVFNRNDKVRVEITNTGPGIPKEFHHKMFQKFMQGQMANNRSIAGTGLGLNISKQFLEKMAGTIGFDSVPDHETTFYFELPIVPKASTSAASYRATHQISILLCIPDNKLAKEICKILEKHHFSVVVVHDSKGVKRVLSEKVIDALIIDLFLPDNDGLSLIRELRSRNYQALPIIAITLQMQLDKHELNGSAFSILDWVEKPIQFERLIQAIDIMQVQIKKNIPNILHVEDDEDLSKVVSELLANRANVTVCPSLKSAKTALNSHQFDLIILDLMLPDGSGIDLLPLISKNHIPVIVFSAYELPKNYVNLVAKALVKTKVSSDELIQEVKTALNLNK